MSNPKVVELRGERTVIIYRDAFPEPGAPRSFSRKADQKLPGGNLLSVIKEYVPEGTSYMLKTGDVILYRIGRGKDVISRRHRREPIPGGMLLVAIYSQSLNTLYKITTVNSRSDHTLDDRIEMALGARGIHL